MQKTIQLTQLGWQLKACMMNDPEYSEYHAAADASRNGNISKMYKPDGSIITYHNGSKVETQA